MKRFLIFIFALFMFGTAYGDDITCPAGSYINDDGECVLCPAGMYSDSENATECTQCYFLYPNSEPGATSVNECYSDWKFRICPITSSGCTDTPCQYRTYVNKVKKGLGYVYSDGDIKDGCSECPASPVALAGYYVNGDKCTPCPANTYSVGGTNTKCTPCPNGATSLAGAKDRAECMRILNYQGPNAAVPTKIYLSGYKNTSPALAVGIGDDVFYANMTAVTDKSEPGMYIGYNNKTYIVGSNAIVYDPHDDTFFITTTPDTDSFNFYINSAGNFSIDWGDGNVETLFYETCARNKISHTYDTPGEYTIKLGGRATEYCKTRLGLTYVYYSVSFTDRLKIAGIGGSLGAIFRTLPDGTNPNFSGLFSGATNLTGQIPSNLFSGITGSPSTAYKSTNTNTQMFSSVFDGCSGLTGQIPVGLFGDLSGAPGSYTFNNAFNGCSGLTGPTARNPDGMPLYYIEYNGQTWYEQSPDAFTDMYTNSGISD